jgi:hypothetical protein
VSTALSIFVITYGTSDYPDRFVVREQRAQGLGPDWPPEGFAISDDSDMVAVAIEPLAIVATLEEARAVIERERPGLVAMRVAGELPTVVETWL